MGGDKGLEIGPTIPSNLQLSSSNGVLSSLNPKSNDGLARVR